MPRLLLAALVAATVAASIVPTPAAAQTHDQELVWRTYSEDRSARVRVFPCDDERRPRTVVVDDRASNSEVITAEASYVADLVGRTLGFDPVGATFVFRFTPASFAEEASESGKTLLLRATFGRTSGGSLSAPQWRVITPDEMEDLTDRAMR